MGDDYFAFSVALAPGGDRAAVRDALEEAEWGSYRADHDGDLVFTARGPHPGRVTDRLEAVLSHVRGVALVWEGEYVHMRGAYYEPDGDALEQVDECVSDRAALFSYFAAEHDIHGPV